MLELKHEPEHEQDLVSQAKQLCDEQLIARLKRLVAQDREVTAQLLVHFGEVDARGLYRDHAYHSMFEYAVRALHMSESEAGLRIRVSRLGRQFPIALAMLARGELHLTALKLLAPMLTRDNLWLLKAARFKSKQQILELLAIHFPKADAPNLIRRLPGTSTDRSAAGAALQPALPEILEPSVSGPRPRPQASPSARTGESSPSALRTWQSSPDARVVASRATALPRPQEVGVGESSSFGLVPPSVASRETPLSPGRYKLQFTADQRLHDKLKQAQELLRHQVPSGDIAVVFERALDLLIAQRKKQLYAQTDKPRAQPAAKACNEGSRHVPHAVRREVLARDGEQCSFVSSDGRRCPAHGMLEFHHQTPYTRGGAATADNIQTLCRAHNALMAERDYGRTFMRERIARQRTVATPPARAVGQRVPERADGALHSEPPRALATPARASSANTSHGSGAVTRANRSTATRPAHATSADGPNLQKQQLTWSNSEPGPKPAQAPSFNAFQSLRT